MTLEDEFQLGPIDKFSKYRRFPTKLTFHVLLVMLATYHAVVYDDWAQYTGNGDDFPYPRYLMITRQELQDGLDSITKNYFQLPLLAVSAIQVYNSTVGAPESWAHSHDQVKLHAPEIEVTRGRGVYDDPTYRRETTTHTFRTRSERNLRPYLCKSSPDSASTHSDVDDPHCFESLEDMILGLRRIYIRLWLVNHDLNDDQSKVLYPHSCHEWLITIKFEAEDGGYIQATSREDITARCSEVEDSGALKWITVLTIATAVWFELLVLRATIRTFALLQQLKNTFIGAAGASDGDQPEGSSGQAGSADGGMGADNEEQYSPLMGSENDEDRDDLTAHSPRNASEWIDALRHGGNTGTHGQVEAYSDVAYNPATINGTGRPLSLRAPATRSSPASANMSSASKGSPEKVPAHVQSSRSMRTAPAAPGISGNLDSAITEYGQAVLDQPFDDALANVPVDDDSVAEGHWRRLTCSERMQVVNVWFIVASVGSVCLTAYCIMDLAIVTERMSTTSAQISLGAGAGLMWFGLLQYLEFNKNYYVLIMTMKKATPDILKLLVGVLPFVMAWTVIGNVVFGTYSDRFKSIRSTAVELFAFVNGDAFRESFQHTEVLGNRARSLVADVYLVSFTFLFMYIVLNILIAINEEAFFSSRPETAEEAGVGGGRKLPYMLKALLISLAGAQRNDHRDDTGEEDEEQFSDFGEDSS